MGSIEVGLFPLLPLLPVKNVGEASGEPNTFEEGELRPEICMKGF